MRFFRVSTKTAIINIMSVCAVVALIIASFPFMIMFILVWIDLMKTFF
jgi:hypothetical protein